MSSDKMDNYNYNFMPYERDYYDVCTYSGVKQQFDAILNVIKKGMVKNNNYEPGYFLLGLCIENDVEPKNTPEVIKLIEKNIDGIKAVYCRFIMDEICGDTKRQGVGPDGKAKDQILNQPTEDKARKQLFAIQKNGGISDENYKLILKQIENKVWENTKGS